MENGLMVFGILSYSWKSPSEIKKTNSTLKLSTILTEDRIFFNWKVDHNSQHGNTTMTPSTTSTTTNTHLIWLFISIFSV
ncbi:hypothetical protein Syun_010244 [Stephania yunnanensis]|uniref:Uncharacterized protein n=1 Tax=Stephania yunnanensis TaxID=152371 RepID=A0AAP0KIQ9_9MAGN